LRKNLYSKTNSGLDINSQFENHFPNCFGISTNVWVIFHGYVP